VSREARRHVTVALTGDGGDETFGGYTFRYIPHAVEGRVRAALPGRHARRLVGRVGAGWPRGSRVPRHLRLGTFLENVGLAPEAAYFADLCFVKPRDVRRLMGRAPLADLADAPAYDAVTAPYRRCSSPSIVQRAQYADLKIYLPNDVLVKVDRMSMQHGLEVRSPLLDHRLVELAFRLPQALKRADQTGKHLLRRLAETRLPPPLLQMRKKGFTAPIGEWIAGVQAGRFREQVLRPGAAIADLLDQATVARMFEEHRRGLRNHTSALWAVWVLERWYAGQAPARASRPLPLRMPWMASQGGDPSELAAAR
jgi:asparagine synthase (glutamine-hydrolysing)